jgi:hypothetical protein
VPLEILEKIMTKWILILLLPVCSLADSVVPIDKVENNINIRLSPDATTDIVGKLDQGSSIELVSTIEGWYEVQLEGDATGYVSSDWSRVVSDEPVIEAVEEVTADETVVEVVVEETVEEAVEEAVGTIVEEAAEIVAPSPIPDALVELKGTRDFVVKFRDSARGINSQIFDDGNQVGIGTTSPKQRLEVNGSIQIHAQNSSVAGLMITQSSGDTGYIMHNRASRLTIGAGSQDRITIDRNGNVGFGVSRPEHPLEMASGAHVTAGGAWTNSSSRALKENIASLPLSAATSALMALQPVLFNYRNEAGEDYVGFIAEDVPDLVAVGDRSALSAMDIVAVLTRVVQEQQNKIKELEDRLDAL